MAELSALKAGDKVAMLSRIGTTLQPTAIRTVLKVTPKRIYTSEDTAFDLNGLNVIGYSSCRLSADEADIALVEKLIQHQIEERIRREAELIERDSRPAYRLASRILSMSTNELERAGEDVLRKVVERVRRASANPTTTETKADSTESNVEAEIK